VGVNLITSKKAEKLLSIRNLFDSDAQSEVSVGFELLPQLVEGYKGALVAQAFKEAHFYPAAIKISFESEYVYLKSSFVSAHCGACAYICHSTEHRAIGQDGVDGKDSGRRKKERSCCRLYVGSRKAYCSAQLTSVDYNTLVKPLMPQKCFGMDKITCSDGAAHSRTAHGAVAFERGKQFYFDRSVGKLGSRGTVAADMVVESHEKYVDCVSLMNIVEKLTRVFCKKFSCGLYSLHAPYTGDRGYKCFAL